MQSGLSELIWRTITNSCRSRPATRLKAERGNGIVTLVDVDFAEYRRKNDMKTVRRNVSLPSWLDVAAKEANVNVSAVLARALKQELNLAER